MITAEDMKALEGYEYYFNTAVNSNYARNFGSKQYRALNDIYERITGRRYKTDFGCPHCTLRFIKELGKLYFAEKKRLETEQVQNELEPENVTASAPKRKPGRPRKQATNNEQKSEDNGKETETPVQ